MKLYSPDYPCPIHRATLNTFCPGCGLTFIGDFAIGGLSKARENSFSGLPLEDNLKAKQIQARCGFLVIDLRSGDIIHALQIEGIISELYDVAILSGVQCHRALGLKTDEIRRVITVPPAKQPNSYSNSLVTQQSGQMLGYVIERSSTS